MQRFLLQGSGLILVVAAVLYNEFLLAFLDPSPPLREATVQQIRSVQLAFLISGSAFFVLGLFMQWFSWVEALFLHKAVPNMMLVVFSLVLPIFLIELSLKPFAYPKTTIFIEDAELGWKLKPNARGMWDRVGVEINGKGLRGPELTYAKRESVFRILYLGDSVTFGHGLDDYRKTFPYLIENSLQRYCTYKIETINAAVDGYSPWQEYIILSREGIKYAPDLVVVSFVLNDVTGKFQLKRFGGESQGSQLARTDHSKTLVRMLGKSSIVYFAGRIKAWMQFGRDIQQGARNQEELNVRQLAHHPEQANVKDAWHVTLSNLDRIFEFCRQQNLNAMLVIFPWTFQFEDITGLSSPQSTLVRFAQERKIPVLDLLPILGKEMQERGLGIKDYFLDDVHLSPLGNKAVSEIMTDFIASRELLVP